MSENPYEAVNQGQSPIPKEKKTAATILNIVVGMAIMFVLACLFLPGMGRRAAPEAARRMQCQNNLKQIALGILNYESRWKALPPAVIYDPEGKPLHSWRTLILPYIEQAALYEKIDLEKPWDALENAEAREQVVPCFDCYSAAIENPTDTTYLALLSDEGAFRPESSTNVTLSDLAPTNQIVMLVDAPATLANHWMAPEDITLPELGKVEAEDLNHNSIMTTALLDGSVHPFPYEFVQELNSARIPDDYDQY